MIENAERLLRELIALPSVNPAFLPEGDPRAGEARMGDFLAAQAGRSGLAVELNEVFPGRANLLAVLQPSGSIRNRVILAPHLDTVGSAEMPASCFSPEIKNGKLHGRGACDTKGSVAAMFTALANVARDGKRPAHTEILFAGLIDEENAQEGSRALAKSGLKANLAIVGEPTELKVVTAHKGDLWLKLTTHGKAAHGARPELGRNAVHEMAQVIHLLETKYARDLSRRKHAVLGSPTINVGAVRGGTQPNIVPDYCEIDIDRRTIPGEKDQKVIQEIVQFIARGGLRVKVINSKLKICPAMETDIRAPMVQSMMALTRQTEPLGVDYFCDAAIIAAAGTPSVVFGPGNIAQAHTADEWISLRSLEGATRLLTRFLRSLP